jgi:hypothetical protein
MDKNGNGLIEMSEFEAAGWEGLQSFKELGADGHHYDVESGTLVALHVLTMLTFSQSSFCIMKKSSTRPQKPRQSRDLHLPFTIPVLSLFQRGVRT